MARIISIADGIKQEIAEKVAQQASAGYAKDYQGEWFLVNGSAVVHKDSNAVWTPWHDDDDVISVEDLVFEFGGASDESADFENSGDGDDYDLTVEFALGYVPDSYDAEAWESRLADERGY